MSKLLCVCVSIDLRNLKTSTTFFFYLIFEILSLYTALKRLQKWAQHFIDFALLTLRSSILQTV